MNNSLLEAPSFRVGSHQFTNVSLSQGDLRTCEVAMTPPAPQPKMKRILITERAKEVLLIMADGEDSEDISEWIMNEWDGYCEMHGQPDFEVG